MIVSEDVCRPKHLGCWADNNHDRAIAGGIRFADTINPIERCHNLAKLYGFLVFAVQYDKQCFTAADAGDTYRKYGSTNRCQNGRGGTTAQDVYEVIPRVHHLTCQGNHRAKMVLIKSILI